MKVKSKVPLSQGESFSLFSQASQKSLNLRLESSHVTRVPHLCLHVTNSFLLHYKVDKVDFE